MPLRREAYATTTFLDAYESLYKCPMTEIVLFGYEKCYQAPFAVLRDFRLKGGGCGG